MDEAVAALEKRLGGKIPTGSNTDFPPIRLTLDKVNVHWRPFAHYLIVNVINCCLHLIFRRFWHMQHGSFDGLEYLVRIPTNWDPITGSRPIVLIHGLGLGLLQYNALIRHFLNNFPDRPLLVLLQPHISQNIFHPRFLRPFSRHETTYRLARLLSQLFRADLDEDAEEKQVKTILTGESKKGVIMVSHSKYVFISLSRQRIHIYIVALILMLGCLKNILNLSPGRVLLTQSPFVLGKVMSVTILSIDHALRQA